MTEQQIDNYFGDFKAPEPPPQVEEVSEVVDEVETQEEPKNPVDYYANRVSEYAKIMNKYL